MDKHERAPWRTRYVALAILGLLVVSVAVPALDGLSLVGFPSDKTYLLILQDNGEIRTTGGLMSFIGLLTVHNGDIKSLRVWYENQSYSGSLVTVDGPASFTTFFGVDSAKLYDSNVQYDFATFAPIMRANYQNMAGQHVDGVVAIDFTAVEELMKLTGPITVSGQVITSRNVVDRSYYYSGITEGGNKTLLTGTLSELGHKIVQDIRDAPPPLQLQFFITIQRLGREKHIQLYPVNDNLLLRAFEGSSDRPSTDFINSLDANLGTGKSDWSINRSIDYHVVLLANRSTVSTLILTYANAGFWEANVFNTVLVPPSATFVAVNHTGTSFEGPLVTHGTTYTAFSAHMRVPAHKTATITYSYTLPRQVHGNGIGLHYDLLVQKQAGLTALTFNGTVQLPQGATVIRSDHIGGADTADEDIHAQVVYRQE
jgi:hypothetical protein